jgi:hypothetical protein
MPSTPASLTDYYSSNVDRYLIVQPFDMVQFSTTFKVSADYQILYYLDIDRCRNPYLED